MSRLIYLVEFPKIPGEEDTRTENCLHRLVLPRARIFLKEWKSEWKSPDIFNLLGIKRKRPCLLTQFMQNLIRWNQTEENPSLTIKDSSQNWCQLYFDGNRPFHRRTGTACATARSDFRLSVMYVTVLCSNENPIFLCVITRWAASSEHLWNSAFCNEFLGDKNMKGAFVSIPQCQDFSEKIQFREGRVVGGMRTSVSVTKPGESLGLSRLLPRSHPSLGRLFLAYLDLIQKVTKPVIPGSLALRHDLPPTLDTREDNCERGCQEKRSIWPLVPSNWTAFRGWPTA